MVAESEVSISATNRKARAVLPLDTPSIHSPMLSRDLEAIKPLEVSLDSYISSKACIVDAKSREMQGMGFEPTKALPPELKSGAVGQAWLPLQAG
tara:strand:- start:653 stop:937 length:285 start_codon:yes stop_codon:yes gene_type:complete